MADFISQNETWGGIRAKLNDSRMLNPLDYEASANLGVVSASAALQDAIDDGKTVENFTDWFGRVIEIPAGKYKITETVFVPPWVRLVARGAVEFDCRDMAAGEPAFWVKWPELITIPSRWGQNPFGVGYIFDGSNGQFAFVGSGSGAGQIAIRWGGDTDVTVKDQRTHLAWTAAKNLHIENFGTGIEFTNKQVYCLTFEHVVMSHNGVCIADVGTSVNSGEQIVWNNCSFHNSDLILRVNTAINHVFNSCSFDYSQQTVEVNATGVGLTLRFFGCWLEASNTPPSVVPSNSSSVVHKPFVKSTSSSSVDADLISVLVTGCYIYPRDLVPGRLFEGYMTLALTDNTFNMARGATLPNDRLASGAFMCDEKVKIIDYRGSVAFNKMQMLSPRRTLNTNPVFASTAVGTVANNANPTTISGITRPNIAGSATITVIDTDYWDASGKCLSVDGASGTFVDFYTNIVPLNGAKWLYGGIVLKYPSSDSTHNITIELQFYGKDGTTALGSVRQTVQNDTAVDASLLGAWIVPLNNTASKATEVIAEAMFVRMRVIIGSLSAEVRIGGIFLDAV